MIHRRKIVEKVKVKDFFEQNGIEEKEDHFVDLQYCVKVNTPYGFYRIPTVCRTVKQKSVRLYFANNKTLECGWDHKLKVNGEWKEVKDINIHNDIIETETGTTIIKKINEGKEKILYDLMVEDVHCFYGNGILSHNTWVLSHIGAEAIRQGKNVLHYTLELTQNYVGQRYDTIFTGIPSSLLEENKEEIKEKIGRLKGGMLVKYYPPKGITANTIAAHIDMVKSTTFQPDLIIIDYADLLVATNSKNNSDYQEAGGIYIDLRALSGEYQIPIWTASQTNRSAIDSDIIQADKIADSYAKVMNADFIISVSRKDTDKLNNTARFHIMKNRFGQDGMTFPSKMDTNKGIIEVYASNSSNGVIASKEARNGEVIQRQLLAKKYVENMG